MSTPYYGATAVGIKTRAGVVLAADKRMSYGGFVMSRNVKKVHPVTRRVGIAIAGFYADMHGLIRILEAEIRYYETSNRVVMPLRAVAKLLSAILYSNKFFPYYVEAIVGGINGDGEPRIYVLDPVGAITEEDYIAVGSGATVALGVLESFYKPDASIEEAEDLAVKAMRAAIARDSSSGDGIDLLTITPDGYREKTIKLRVVTS
ncbi:archaeal proteasome endopeptidase complex subunit beta [Stetteria hydrogenophila]